MSGVLTILGKCQVLLNAPDAWKNAAEIIPMRKALKVMSRDETLTLQERYDLAMAAEACKHVVNSVPLRERLKGYPESKLYGHESLTSKCCAKIVKLAEKFAFKPQPLALGVKHYFAPK